MKSPVLIKKIIVFSVIIVSLVMNMCYLTNTLLPLADKSLLLPTTILLFPGPLSVRIVGITYKQ